MIYKPDHKIVFKLKKKMCLENILKDLRPVLGMLFLAVIREYYIIHMHKQAIKAQPTFVS